MLTMTIEWSKIFGKPSTISGISTNYLSKTSRDSLSMDKTSPICRIPTLFRSYLWTIIVYYLKLCSNCPKTGSLFQKSSNLWICMMKNIQFFYRSSIFHWNFIWSLPNAHIICLILLQWMDIVRPLSNTITFDSYYFTVSII